MSKLQIPPNKGSSAYGVKKQKLPLPAQSGQGQGMGRRTQRLLKALGVLTAVLLTIFGAGGPEDSIDAVRQFVTFATRGTSWEAASWLTAAHLAVPARIGAILGTIGLFVWVIWPERGPKVAASPAPANPEDKYVVGGRVEDEPGLSIGPLPALEYWCQFLNTLRKFLEMAHCKRLST